MARPSISVRNCGIALSRASVARQSYSSAQSAHSACRYASGTPWDQSATGSRSGQRAPAAGAQVGQLGLRDVDAERRDHSSRTNHDEVSQRSAKPSAA